MWRWRSMPVLNLIGVSLSLLMADVQAAPTSAGPTSTQEAQTIWLEGKRAFDESRLSEAAQNLQRLVDRYPGDPHQNDAMEILGETYLQLNQATRAIPLLLAAVDTHPREGRGQKTRLILGEAYLVAKKYDEALLIVQEIEKVLNQANLNSTNPATLRSESVLLKGRTLLAKNHLERAQLSLLSLESELPRLEELDLRDRIYAFRLQLGLSQCTRITTPGPLTERQVQDQMERSATCLIEKIAAAKPLFLTKNPKIKVSLPELVGTAFKALRATYRQPAAPPELKNRKRTSKELSKYRSELSLLLKPIYQGTISQVRELLETWNGQTPSSDPNRFNPVLKVLEKLDA